VIETASRRTLSGKDNDEKVIETKNEKTNGKKHNNE